MTARNEHFNHCCATESGWRAVHGLKATATITRSLRDRGLRTLQCDIDLMAEIKFGTDGWRAVIAEGFTFSNLDRVAQATADFWKSTPVAGTKERAVVGYDRRFLSDKFAARTAEILAGNGFEVTLTSEPTPTPAVSFMVKAQRAVGGVMITASHNPPIFNGFKLKAHYGGSAEPAICQAVEKRLDQNPVQALDLDRAVQDRRVVIQRIRPGHYQAIKKLVDFPLIAKSKLCFAHDALYGVGAGCFDELLAGTTCKVTTLNGQHDPFFGGINPEPIEKNYAASAAFLKKHPHDICLVTDGDADRVGAMDGRGHALSTHQLICLLLHHFVVNRQERGRVVKALTTTSMMDKMCAEFGLTLVETGVGFKYICAEMLKGDVLLGAEESGGIGFPGHIPGTRRNSGGSDVVGVAGDGARLREPPDRRLGKEIWPASLRPDRRAFPAGKARGLDGVLQEESARPVASVASCRRQILRRRKVHCSRRLLADVTRLWNRTDPSDLRRSEI